MAKQKLNLETVQIGVAGEYYAAAELSRRGIIASITLRNSRGVDIVATNSSATKSVSIQVKTNSEGLAGWQLGSKADAYCAENLFYIFVILRPLGQRPDFYVAPSNEVAEWTSNHYRELMARPKRDGTRRKDVRRLIFADKEGKYKEAWHLLGLGIS